MLDISNAKEIGDLWDALDTKAVLPGDPSEFFGKQGPTTPEELRDFTRHYMRCQGLVRFEREAYGVYLKDCSRAGMGFISPVQFFPRQRVQLWISQQRNYSLEIIRCRKVLPGSYECGAIFILK